MKKLSSASRLITTIITLLFIFGCSSKHELRPYSTDLSKRIASYDVLLVKPTNKVILSTLPPQFFVIPKVGMITTPAKSSPSQETPDHEEITQANAAFHSSISKFSSDIEASFQDTFNQDRRLKRFSAIEFDTLNNRIFEEFRRNSKSDAVLIVSVSHIYNSNAKTYGVGVEARFAPISEKLKSLRKQPDEHDHLNPGNFVYRGVFNFIKDVSSMAEVNQTLKEASEQLPKSVLADISDK